MESLKGLGVIAVTSALSGSGWWLRTNYIGITQELGALAEVTGHFITFVVYGDAAVTELKRSIHGEITARINNAIIPNKPGEPAFWVDLPMLGESITEATVLRDVTRPFAVNKLHQTYPSIFDKWGSIAEYPKSFLPAIDSVGLLPGILALVFSDVGGWSSSVGGDTYIGRGYRYVLPAWKAFYNGYVYVREVERVNDYISHDSASPMIDYILDTTGLDIQPMIGNVIELYN